MSFDRCGHVIWCDVIVLRHVISKVLFQYKDYLKISRNAASATTSHTPPSPDIAPATRDDSHDWSAPHMKCYLRRALEQKSASNSTQNCACHSRWLSHARCNKSQPPTPPNTAPATKNESDDSQSIRDWKKSIEIDFFNRYWFFIFFNRNLKFSIEISCLKINRNDDQKSIEILFRNQ